jgi:hypothetical protein
MSNARRISRGCAFAMLLGFGSTTSCESSEVDRKPTDSGQSCIARDKKHSLDASFSVGKSSTRNVAECVPTCGEDTEDVDGFLSIAALPAGSCAREPECEMGAFKPCACAPKGGPVDVYRCSCKGGEWACQIVSQAARACPPCDDEDAG